MTLATLARFLLTPTETRKLMKLAATVMESQADLILKQHDRLQRIELDHYQELRGLVAGWLISLESPEIDIRDDLAMLDRDLGDRIAILEEHLA